MEFPALTIDNGIVRLSRMLEVARRVVVFTGAGISTESGIPDFRSPGGIWQVSFKEIDAKAQRRKASCSYFTDTLLEAVLKPKI